MGNGADPRWDQVSRIRCHVEQALSCIPATADVMAAHVDQALSRIPATAYVPGAPRASAAFPAPLTRIPFSAVAPYVPVAATQVAPYVPAAAAPHASAVPPLHIPRRIRPNRRRKRRRQYLAEEAAASRDPSLTPAPALGTHDLHAATSCPASSSAAATTAAVPISHVPASATSVDPRSHVPAAPHATATRPTPLYRIPAVPNASGASPFPISRIPAAPHTAVTSTSPHIPAAPPASASPAAAYFSPPRELSKRATGSAFSAPRKFSQRPAPAAEGSDCQIVGAVGVAGADRVTSVPHASATPLSRMPEAPNATAASPFPLSHTPAAPPRASASTAADHYSPPRELSQPAAASGCGDSPPRELSQCPAAVATEKSDCQIVGAVGLAGDDRVRSVPHASTTPLPCIPAAPNPFPLPRIPAVPHATASQSVHYSPQESSPSAPRPVDATTPPCELSQRPAAVATEESNCQIVGEVGLAGADRIGRVPPVDARMASEAHVKSVPGERHTTVGREEESKSAEELKRELERVSKEMNDLRNEFAELKKGMKNKDLEIEAKEAEIRNLKKAKVGCSSKDICSTRMDIDQSYHTPANEALLAEGSRWTSTRRAEKLNGKNKELYSSRDGTSTLGGYLEENAHLETKSNKCKDIKAKGVQTDIQAALHFRIREVAAYYTSPSSTTTCAPPLPYVPASPHASAAFAAPLSRIPAYIPGAPHAYAAFAAPHSRTPVAAYRTPPSSTTTCAPPIPNVPTAPHASAAFSALLPRIPAVTPVATYVPSAPHAHAAFAAPHFPIPASATRIATYCTSPSTTTTCAPPLPYVPAVPHASAAFAAPPLPHPR